MTSPFIYKEANREYITGFISHRPGEVKLGERIALPGQTNQAKYVILGVSEDIGPQANGGRAGSKTAFKAFLSRFLNMQHNRFQQGDDYLLLGEISQQLEFETAQAGAWVSNLDHLMEQTLTPWIEQGMVPLVIGGGHNNAFPLIKTAAKKSGNAIAVVNCDAHADFRACDFRHSGNSFSWAMKEAYLDQYLILALHQAYNNEYILSALDEAKCTYSFLEDYIINPGLWEEEIEQARKKMGNRLYGLELDMDVIAGMPSSAMSPTGLSMEQARYYIMKMARGNVAYLHLPEAAPQNENEMILTGKALAFLITDFVKQHKAYRNA